MEAASMKLLMSPMTASSAQSASRASPISFIALQRASAQGRAGMGSKDSSVRRRQRVSCRQSALHTKNAMVRTGVREPFAGERVYCKAELASEAQPM